MTPRFRLVFFAAILGACSKPAPEAPVSRLQELVRGLGSIPPCSRNIPLEWSSSWPIPVLRDGRLAYRVFFFGREGRPPRFTFHDAEGDALFSPNGRVFSCSRRPRAGAVLPPDRRFEKATLGEISAREERLYRLTEETANLFAAAKPLSSMEETLVSEFAASFAALADPGQSASYRALNPDFWTWVEKNGGSAPAAK